MKIGILTIIINSHSGSRAPLDIASALKKQGHDITIVAYSGNKDSEAVNKLLKEKIKIIFIKNRGFGSITEISRILNNSKIELISFHGNIILFLGALLSRLPVIRTYYGTQLNAVLDKTFISKPDIFKKLLNKIGNYLILEIEKFISGHSANAIAISKFTKMEYKKLYGKNIEYVYLGKPQINSEKTGLITKKNPNKINIISVSRIIPYKGFHDLIFIFNELVEKYPLIHLSIIGSTPDKPYLSYLKKIAGKNINFYTDISDKQLSEFYSSSDIYATFDKNMFFGMPVIEAAGYGIPSVALNHAAAGEIISHNKTGYVSDDLTQFSKYLERLINDSKLRYKFSKEAKLHSDKFSLTILGKKYTYIFEKTQENLKKTDHVKEINYITSLILITLTGFLLRLLFIDHHPFWFDEAISFYLSNQSLTDIIKTSALDTQPPIYYLLLNLWGHISGSAWFLRSLSLIFGIAAIPASFIFFNKLMPVRTALLASTFLSLSPLQIYFSVETRMYSMLAIFILLLLLAFINFLKIRTTKYLFLVILLGILSLYTHYYSVLILIALNIYFLLHFKQFKIPLLSWMISQVIIGLSLLPLLLNFFSNLTTPCWCFNTFQAIPALLTSYAGGGMGYISLKEYYLYGPKIFIVLLASSALILFLFFLKGLLSSKNFLPQSRGLLFTMFFIPILIISIPAFFYPIFSPRAFIILSPIYYLYIAAGITAIKNNKTRVSLIFITFILLLAISFYNKFDPFFLGPPLKKTSDFISRNFIKNEIILHASPMTYYSALYYIKNSPEQFLLQTPSNFINQYSHNLQFQKTDLLYKSFILVDFPLWTNQKDIEKIIKQMSQKKYNLKKFCIYNKSCNDYNKILIYQFTL